MFSSTSYGNLVESVFENQYLTNPLAFSLTVPVEFCDQKKRYSAVQLLSL